MVDQKKFIVSHAPFWHSGKNVTERNYGIIIAALPAVLAGIYYYGMPALGVVSLSVSFSILWELAFNYVAKRPNTVGDGNAALIGLLFGMMLPATAPFWFVITGTFVAVVIGKQIYGGIGSNPFNPALVAVAMLMLSWKKYFDFDAMLINYDFDFTPFYPLVALRAFGTSAIESISILDLLVGRQVGGIGATFGLGLIAGGLYLIYKGYIRWEIPLSFLVGVFITSLIFHLAGTDRFAGPAFHIFTGYTLIGAFFLATEDSTGSL